MQCTSVAGLAPKSKAVPPGAAEKPAPVIVTVSPPIPSLVVVRSSTTPVTVGYTVTVCVAVAALLPLRRSIWPV